MTDKHDRPQPHNGPQGGISPDVAAAMARLAELRAERGIGPAAGPPPARVDQDQAPAVDWQLSNAIKVQNSRRAELDQSRGGAAWSTWAAARLTSSQNGPQDAQAAKDGQFPTVSPQNAPQARFTAAGRSVAGDPPVEAGRATVRIAPDMILFAAQCGDFAAARLYSVIAALDPAGRRLVYQEDITRLLTDKGSAWYLYGRRRLLAVLAAGAGVFWDRDKDRRGRVRIALRSRARIVAHYGITLTGHEVIMPVTVLLADVRDHGRAREAAALAAVYAAAHAGRQSGDKPIARAKLRELTGLSRWRQRRYERRRGIASRKQIAIDGNYSDHRLATLRQSRIAAWRHVDRRGLYGPRGAAYVGRQLPNLYKSGSQYARVNSTRQRRRINAQAAGLSSIRDMGARPVVRVFYDDPRQAGKAASREIGRVDARPVYTRQPDRAGDRRRVRVGVWRDMARAEYEQYRMVPQLEKWGVI